MTEVPKVGKYGQLKLKLNLENIAQCIAVYHFVDDGTLSLMYYDENALGSRLQPFDMDGNGDDKMLIGTSRNAGSLVQLLSTLTNAPYYRLSNPHFDKVGIKLYVRGDFLDNPYFRDYTLTNGPMAY